MRAGEHPRIHLQHNHNWRLEGSLGILTYSLHPIPVPRPAKGVKTAPVRCGACETELDVRVYSAQLTRITRSLLLLVGVGALVATVLVAVLLMGSDEPRNGSEPPESTLSYLPVGFGIVALFTVGTVGIVGSYFYDGVRLPRRSGHALRRPRRRSRS
ncbi:hypothetical protein [Amycolatopsis regifaucium]|nr:hypothetical protein [Amycolatopsis regifaucium]KZB88267.1 hypothetical protein AVL48_20135 [Amycolatopsis regifaucium]SFH43203.1 hypothetical protein SAMN04489731_104157 [Amycolatopsis regifaucium]